MKFGLFVLVFVVFIVPSLAHALSIGDSATYSVLASGQTQTMVQTVTQISGDTYTASTTLNDVAAPDTTGSISQIEQMNSAYSNCAQFGGQITTVNTQSGNISTCHISQSGEDLYLSPKVTFGIVKMVTPDNGGETLTLETYFAQ